MDRTAKAQWRDEISRSFAVSSAIFVAHYEGMTVDDLTSFRRELKNIKADFCVVKNAIAKKAIEGQDQAIIAPLLKGQTGVVFAYGDVAAAAKAVNNATKKFEKLRLTGGYMEKSLLDVSTVEQLASLPSREVLIGRLVSTLIAPHRGLLRTLQGVQTNLVQVLNAIKDKKAS